MSKMAAGGVSQAAVNEFKHACAVSISVACFILFVFIVWDPSLQDQSAVKSSSPAENAVPASNLRIEDVLPASNARTDDVVPASNRRTEDVVPTSNPRTDDVVPASNPRNHSTVPTSNRSEVEVDEPNESENVESVEPASIPLMDSAVPASTPELELKVDEPESDFSLKVESVNLRKLIQDIRDTAKLASAGVSYDLTEAERKEWRRQNPCKSRTELLPMYDLRKNVQKLSRNVLLDGVLYEYSKLHRACTQKLGTNLTDFFLGNKTVPGCKFIVGSPMYGTGLGNKMIVTISAVIYAVLTQRILLVPVRTHLPTFMCEPFVGSSWTFDTSTFPMPDGKTGRLPWETPVPKSLEWAEEDEFLQAADNWIDTEQQKSGLGTNLTDFSGLQVPALTYALSVTITWQPQNRFYCSAEQEILDEVPWLYWGGCIYTVPKLFGSALFGPTLRDLFPDRMVMALMLRAVLLPSDDVFSKLLEVNNKYFRPGDRRVGIQLRNRQGEEYFERMEEELNRRILNCGVEKGFLPNTSMSSWDSEEKATTSPKTKVFIASLYRGVFEYLNKFYQAGPADNGEIVELVQVSSREHQKLGAEEDIQAFVEILVLSLSDQLLVTPASTFGSIAQGYGAMTPWFIETREDKDEKVYGSCERAQSIDICHQYTEVAYECPHSLLTEKKIDLDKELGFSKCLDIDHSFGVQLISTFESDISV